MSRQNLHRSSGRAGTLLAFAKRISSALDSAIRDAEIEKTQKLTYFYDADVIVESVLGLTTWMPSEPTPDVSSLSYVSRALFSVGFLPAAHLLRPHLIELERFVKRIPLPRGLEPGFRAEHLRHLLRRWSLDRHDSTVMENVDDWAGMEQLIRREGFEIFVKLELCYGGLPYDRLLRILPNCIVRSGELGYPPMRAGDRFAEFISETLSIPATRRRKQINNLIDGYALSELAHHVSCGQPVRFYTETLPMQRLGEHLEFCDLSGHTVFRDAEYFVMRSSFPAIGFTHLEPLARANVSNERTLAEISVINHKLKELLSSHSKDVELERAIEHERVDSGASLAELIDDFYQLRFLSNVVLDRWQVPNPMRELVPYLANFFDDPQRLSAVREALNWRLAVTSAALEQEISYLAKWRYDVNYVHEAITQRRHDFFDRTPDPWRDLGLGRWGFDVLLPEGVREDLCGWLSEITDADIHVDRLASDLALQLAPDPSRDSENFALLLCKLWCLQMYERLVHEWQESASLFIADMPVVVQTLYYSAQLKTISPSLMVQSAETTQRLLNVVADAKKAFSSLLIDNDPRIVGVALMVEAHISYWAWRRLLEVDGFADAQVMVERSFEAAYQAGRNFTTRSLAWAFAINHCVYVGTVAHIRKRETGLLRAELSTVNRNHYHYRFADTAARQFTEQVSQEVSQRGIEAIAVSPAHRQYVCDLIHKAQQILNASPPSFGDEEVKAHRMLLDGYQITLGCR
jgi:hypothetical protein